MTISPRPSGRLPISTDLRRSGRRPRRPARPSGHLSELGVEITASRLRVLGHPVRLRIMRALDERHATVPQLATELGVKEIAVAAHVRLLHRAGILARVDGVGPPAFQLCDWPSLWMVDQLARRLREQTENLSDPDTDVIGDEDPDEGFTCR